MQGTICLINAVMHKKRLTQSLIGAGRSINKLCVGDLGFAHAKQSTITRNLAADIKTHRSANSKKFMFI
jgi:hypothetical protein